MNIYSDGNSNGGGHISMTVEEAIIWRDNLDKFIKNNSDKIGFNDDFIFLLSAEEYEDNKDNISRFCPYVGAAWWLRSSSNEGVNYVTVARNINSTKYTNANFAYRPAIKIKKDDSRRVGTEIFVYDARGVAHPFVKIGIYNIYDLYLCALPVRWGLCL